MINNKRIAKNILMLYLRMFFLMIVNLYTSRIVLQALGVEDYGVYNAVAGFITMFSLISSSITSAISRFITYVLGQEDHIKLKKVFSTALLIQITLALIIVLLVEFIGVWFLNTHMIIPDGREIAANWILQFALFTFVFNLWSTPYNAALIAHEKMEAFAYIGIFEGSANLVIAFLVMYSSCDSLILYGGLMCIVAFITRLIYNIYCKRHFSECRFQWIFDKQLFKEMCGFAGWNFIGSISGLLREQGINILFNVYYGPIVNAARGLASQVQAAITKFSQSFFVAVQPQITKSYANNKINESHDLVLRSSRLAFLLLTALILPVVIETKFLLEIWLKDVPEHTISFVRIILTASLIDSFSSPLVYLMLATGKIKKYQIIVGTFNILNFPIAWLVLYCGGTPELSLLTIIVFSFIALLLRLMMLKSITNFPIIKFIKNTVMRCLFILIVSIIPSFIILKYMPIGLPRFCINIFLIEIVFFICTFLLGFNSNERRFLKNKVCSYINRR